MIETLQVIRCDTPVHLPARPPRPGHPDTDGRPRTVQCSRFFPARGGLTQAWQAALKRGWTITVLINARDRHTCPDHSTPTPSPGSTP